MWLLQSKRAVRRSYNRVVVPTESCYILCTCKVAQWHVPTFMLCCERWTMFLLASHKVFCINTDLWSVTSPPANRFFETSQNDDNGETGRGLLPVNPCLRGVASSQRTQVRVSKDVAFLTAIKFNPSMSFVYESWSQNKFTGLIFSGVSTSNRNSWDLTVLLSKLFHLFRRHSWGILHIVGQVFALIMVPLLCYQPPCHFCFALRH